MSDEEKTTYSIEDETGQKSSITIDKWAADILQVDLDDVHNWIQKAFDHVSSKRPDLSRRKRGDFVRSLAYLKANENEEHKRRMRELFE